MPYTTPTPSTVSAGDTFPASAYNIISADIQDHETRIKTGVELYTTAQKNVLAGVATGTVIFDLSLSALQVYTGSAWVGVTPAGVISPYGGTAAPGGWVLCDGSTLNSVTSTQYAALFAAIGTTYGGSGASSFILPDLQGRMPVGKGSNADVASLGLNDGAALASRRPAHKHTNVVSQTTTGAQSYGSIVNNTNFAAGGGSAQRYIVNSSQANGIAGNEGDNSFSTALNHTHSVGVTTGPQTASPTDAPSFLVVNYIIKL